MKMNQMYGRESFIMDNRPTNILFAVATLVTFAMSIASPTISMAAQSNKVKNDKEWYISIFYSSGIEGANVDFILKSKLIPNNERFELPLNDAKVKCYLDKLIVSEETRHFACGDIWLSLDCSEQFHGDSSVIPYFTIAGKKKNSDYAIFISCKKHK